MEWNGIESKPKCLKPECSTDHSTNTWATRPATVDLALRPNISVVVADGHAAGSAKALVVGVE
jgi:hypothetical protein